MPGDYLAALPGNFRADATWQLVTKGLRNARLAVTRIRCDRPDHGLNVAGPAHKAFSVLVQRRDAPKRELFLGGRSVYRKGYAARSVSIVALEEEPTAFLGSPFDHVHFYVSRQALDEIAEDHDARRIERLDCERGMFDPVVWNLTEALLPALENPGHVSTMYADHMLLSAHTYFATTFGGMLLSPPSRRGCLSAWQFRRATELMLENIHLDLSLAEPARACGLSVSYFSRAFKQTTGEPPHRWLMRKRIEHSKLLLRQTSLPLIAVATDCGFADQSHFTRTFSASVGATPAAWRRAVGN